VKYVWPLATGVLLVWFWWRSRRAPAPLTVFGAGLDPVRATAHFTWGELDRTGVIRASPNGQQRLHELAVNIETVRQYLNTPIAVVSSTVNANGYVSMIIGAPATLPDGSRAFSTPQLISTIKRLQRDGRVQFGNVAAEGGGIRVENGPTRWSP
jgi:hypothetical protein